MKRLALAVLILAGCTDSSIVRAGNECRPEQVEQEFCAEGDSRASASYAATSGSAWSAGFDSGDLSEWTGDGNGNHTGDGFVTRAAARTGSHGWRAMNESSVNAKLLRWRFDYEEAEYSAWFRWPSDYRVRDLRKQYVNFFQWKERTDPWASTWVVAAKQSVHAPGPDEIVLHDYRGESGRHIYRNAVELPKDRWFQVRARYKVGRTDGRITVWVDGERVFHMTGVNTLGARSNDSPAYVMWGVGNFAANSGSSASGGYIDVDDASVTPVDSGSGGDDPPSNDDPEDPPSGDDTDDPPSDGDSDDPPPSNDDDSDAAWTSDFERGNVSEWNGDGNGSHEGSGYVTRAAARSGSYGWRAYNDGSTVHNKLLRWRFDYDKAEYEAWFRWPSDYVVEDLSGQYVNIFQWKERTSPWDPTWVVAVKQAVGAPGDGEIVLHDYSGDSGRHIHRNAVRLPKDRWFKVRARYELGRRDGRITVWVDGNLAFDLSGVNTIGSSDNRYTMWGVGNYAPGSASGATGHHIDVDDASVTPIP